MELKSFIKFSAIGILSSSFLLSIVLFKRGKKFIEETYNSKISIKFSSLIDAFSYWSAKLYYNLPLLNKFLPTLESDIILNGLPKLGNSEKQISKSPFFPDDAQVFYYLINRSDYQTFKKNSFNSGIIDERRYDCYAPEPQVKTVDTVWINEKTGRDMVHTITKFGEIKKITIDDSNPINISYNPSLHKFEYNEELLETQNKGLNTEYLILNDLNFSEAQTNNETEQEYLKNLNYGVDLKSFVDRANIFAREKFGQSK